MKNFGFLIIVFFNTHLFSQNSEAIKEKAFNEYSNGNYNQAIVLYTKLITSFPPDYTNFQIRALCYTATKQHLKAIEDCNKVLTFSLGVADKYYSLYIRAIAYAEMEKFKEALKDMDSCSVFYYDNRDFMHNKIHFLYEQKEYRKSISECLTFLKLNSINKRDSLVIYDMLGFSYLRLDSLSQSVLYADKLFKMDSLSDSYLYLKAAIYDNQDSIQKAADCYSTIIRLDSTDAHAYYCRGTMLNSLEVYDLAIKDLKKSQAMSEADLYSSNYQLGNSYNGLKKYDTAIGFYSKCLKIRPGSSDIYNQIAWTYFLAKKYSDGFIYVNKAIELDRNNENAYDTRGVLNYKLRKYDEAIKDFNSALKIDADYSNSYYFRALSYLKKRKSAEACLDLEILQKDKDYKVKDGEKPIEVLVRENCLVK